MGKKALAKPLYDLKKSEISFVIPEKKQTEDRHGNENNKTEGNQKE